MRARVNCFLPLALIAGLGLSSGGSLTAQTFTVLHAFTPVSGPNATNSDGANPSGGFFLSGNTLYGTALYGGSASWGAVFAINTDGSGFAAPYHFTGGSDGANPSAGVIFSNNELYGTASGGGVFGAGTVFAVNANGTGFTNLHSFTQPANNSFGSFTNSDGAYPQTGLILSGNVLYGAANNGGASGLGTLFAIGADGSGFRTVHSFSSGTGGAYSSGGLVVAGNTLNGANYGNLGNGTVFAVNTDSTGFTNNYAFTSGHLNGSGILTNSDGANPHANLIFSGNTLYGTTVHGGDSGYGTVFSVSTNGTGFTTLHDFAAGGYNSLDLFTNSDGANPSAGLLLSGDTLYGTTTAGGSSGNGTVFVLKTDGTGFANLYSFSATPRYPAPPINSDGANPSGGLAVSGYSLYGMTAYGGSSGNGVLFSLSFKPQLTIVPSGTNVILTWPTNLAGFDLSGFKLQSAPAVTGAFTNIPSATNPYTNPITGTGQFFRLSQ